MISYAPFHGYASRPFLAQAEGPSDALLIQLIGLQAEIAALITDIPQGTVDRARVDALTKKVTECQTLGPTTEAVKCLTDLRSEIQALRKGTPLPSVPRPVAPSAAPVWPWIVGGVAVAGAAALLIFSK